MKSNIMFWGMGKLLSSCIKESVPKKERKAIRKEYKAILGRAKDIGKHNTLLSSYGLAAYFIATVRNTRFSPEECRDILKDGMGKSKLFRSFMGNAEGYFSEKHMEMRRKWSKETHKKQYENDWVVDVIEGDGNFRFGFDYLECGVVKLTRDEGCPELAKYLCSLDFFLVEIIGIRLVRTGTLAEGQDKCDFRFYEK